ncbi:hypothetical protein PGTUg99_019568 [Puccinia graminis f. sp. tritici]|uniref:Uncharacterized protein n=1 Tax=Puccinia graminis f. sp. tritici TaxID=56615 RepID=A0A5B0NF11_PUCGR|nr:hypothetical protein PGTUg99_019568 [Puccinia graminis f. sp. tritici]
MVSSDVNSDSLHQSHLSHLFSVTSSSSKIDKPTSSASNPFNFQLSRYCLSNRTMNSTITQSLPSLILLMLISCGFTLCQVGTGYDAMCEKHNPPMAPYCFDYYKASSLIATSPLSGHVSFDGANSRLGIFTRPATFRLPYRSMDALLCAQEWPCFTQDL